MWEVLKIGDYRNFLFFLQALGRLCHLFVIPMKKLLLPLFILAVPHISHGAITSYESFSYTAGETINGKNGGTGFSGGWGNQTAATINLAGLTYANLTTTGNSVNLTGDGIQVFRGLTGTGGGSGSNVWQSFLISTSATNVGLSLFNGGNEQTFKGRTNGGNYGALFYEGTGRPINDGLATTANVGISMTPAVANATTHLYVVNFDQTGATPVYRGWLDPDASSLGTGSAPTGGSTFTLSTNTQFFNYTQLRLGAFSGPGAVVNFDELRLGDTWADVSPIPEPSSLLLLSVGALGLLRRRR